MSLAGIGNTAVGTAGVLLLKDQLFDKEHRVRLQQQMGHLLRQQAWIVKQMGVLSQEISRLGKPKEGSSFSGDLMI
ncbi:hypothetical protein [Nafulsella turpanensis]|uniref:hypothetical protein n=1 Tax=Nafulsella turpanensis TaxID=1265690 RepID=UPI00037E2850|nr:hypothetical protein [Nafulsella turpanensis]